MTHRVPVMPCLISVDIFFNNEGVSIYPQWRIESSKLYICPSFYPIFPVPLELSSDVNLDISHSDGLRLGSDPDGIKEYAPDVLILPSRLKHFSKVSGLKRPDLASR